MVLCTTAVGENYNKFVLDFLTTDFSSNFKIHILTDRPELYQNVHTDLYYSKTFNYFDKITYGVTIINKLNTSGFIVDSDDILNFVNLYKKFDTSSELVQFLDYWNQKGTLDTNPSQYDHIWEFFHNFLKEKNIDRSNIYMVLEKVFFFPKFNYGAFINYFESLRFKFEENSRKFGMHKNGVGNGEGIALGYALYMSGLNHKKVV